MTCATLPRPAPTATAKRKRIGLDVDGCVANLLFALEDLYLEMFGKEMPHLRHWEIGNVIPEGRAADYWRYVGQSRVHVNGLQPYPGAVDAVRRLSEVADVYFVTSPLSTDPHWRNDRDTWLGDHFGAPENRIVYTKDKTVFAGHMLIDDMPTHVESWAHENDAGTAVCMARHYNELHDFGALKHRIVRTSDWNTIVRLASPVRP